MSKPRVILTCKQVSRTLLEDHYRDLPWHKKVAVKFHLSWCWICGKFNRQVIAMQQGIDCVLSHEVDDPVPPNLRMPDESKDRVLDAIRNHRE